MSEKKGLFSVSLFLQNGEGLKIKKDILVQVIPLVKEDDPPVSEPEPKIVLPLPVKKEKAPPPKAFKGVDIKVKPKIEEFNSTRMVDFNI